MDQAVATDQFGIREALSTLGVKEVNEGTSTGQKWLGAITPIGGVGFILGWFFLLMAIIKLNF